MQRDEKALAVVIKSENVGERDRVLTLLTSSGIIVRSRVYGAQKSAKSIKAPLFSEAVFSLYYKSESNVSVKDVDIINLRSEIGEDLDSLTAASLFSELILRYLSHDEDVYSLLSKCLDSLSLRINYKRICIIFILKFLTLAGVLSDYESCPVCFKRYSKDEILGYNSLVGESCCQNCSTGEEDLILPSNARLFISECIKRDFDSILSFNISEKQEDRIFRFLLRLVDKKTEGGLKTLSSGLWPYGIY